MGTQTKHDQCNDNGIRIVSSVEEKGLGIMSGFRPGWSTIDHIFLMRQMLGKSNAYIVTLDLKGLGLDGERWREMCNERLVVSASNLRVR